MRNNKAFGIYLVLLFIIIFYFGYEAKAYKDMSSFKFFNMYFANYQKTLFTGTILLVPVVFFSHIDHLQPEMIVRIKDRTFKYVWSKYVLITSITSIFFLFSYTIVSKYFDFSEPLSILKLDFFLRVFLFIMTCFVIKELIYLYSKNLFLGISVIVVLNFILLLILSYLNIYLEFKIDAVVYLYTICVNIFGLLFLFIKTNKMEILR